MKLSRGSLVIGVAAASLLTLSGCASKIFGPTSAQREAYAEQQARQAAGSGAAASGETTASAAATASKPPKAVVRREFDPEVIDILTVFQKRLSDNSKGFDSENIVSGSTGIGELVLVTRGMKLHRHPDQNRVYYVISGRGDIVLDGSGSSVRAGHVIAVPAGTPLSIMPAGEQPLRLLLVKMPGQGFNTVQWLKEPDEPDAKEEEEVDELEPMVVPDLGEEEQEPAATEETAESSAPGDGLEDFQTGTLSQ